MDERTPHSTNRSAPLIRPSPMFPVVVDVVENGSLVGGIGQTLVTKRSRVPHVDETDPLIRSAWAMTNPTQRAC